MRSPRSLARWLRDQLSTWPATARLVWTAASGWTVAWAALLVFQGLLPAALVYATKLAIDALVPAMKSGGEWGQVRPALVWLAVAGGLMLATEVARTALEWVRTAQSELVQDHIKRLIHRQAAAVDVAFYESSEYHDALYQASTEAANRPLQMLESVGTLVQNAITLVAMAAILATYGVWLPVVLFVSTLPSLLVVVRFDRVYHTWWQATTPTRRLAQYYDMLVTHKEAAPELRLFGLSEHFSDAYQAIRRGLREERLSQLRRLSLAKLGASVAALVAAGAAMAWMAWRTLQGRASLGDLALLYQAFTQGQAIMRTLLGGVGQIITNNLYLANLFGFLGLRPRVADPKEPVPVPSPLREGISFRNVTFTYPGSATPVLRDFDLEIPAGKIVAIVGPNGAGKTTLFKLLCRFYDVDAGSVAIDGVDVRRFSLRALWRQITVLFQFPLPYFATAGQSIAMGDVQLAPIPEEIESAARSAGAHELIMRLPKGYDTLLGKWFAEGVELSGGQAQRIALARAYLRRAPVILLDEPTSYIDSWAEAEWFEHFRGLARGRTAIVITHRFTIAMRADAIQVMDGGRVVESGTHRELVARGGVYAESWAAQMRAAQAEGESEPEPRLAAGRQ